MKRELVNKNQVVPSDDRFEVVGVFNAASVIFEGETLLLVRVAERVKQTSTNYLEIPILDGNTNQITVKRFDYSDSAYDFSDPRIIKSKDKTFLTSMSHFRVANVKNGEVIVSQSPSILPYGKYETNGIEDPRITVIDGTYYITYACSSENGILCGLIKTKDFRQFERMGYCFHPDNKDMVLFPEKINGKYYCLHRPSTSDFGKRSIWIAESPDLICWGNHQLLIDPRPERFDSGRVGAGAPPIKIKEGWLEIYHGANEQDEYCLGALLLDGNDPHKILARTKEPIVIPSEDFEKRGFFSNVVFTCGAILQEDILKIYYGAADTCVGLCEIPLSDVLNAMTETDGKIYDRENQVPNTYRMVNG